MANVIEDLTMGEMERIETKCRRALSTLEDPEKSQAEMLSTILWVYRQRTDPNAKLEDVKNMRLAEVVEELGLGEDEDE